MLLGNLFIALKRRLERGQPPWAKSELAPIMVDATRLKGLLQPAPLYTARPQLWLSTFLYLSEFASGQCF